MKKEKTIVEMTKEIVSVFKRYEKTGTKPWTYKIASKDLSYQVGSLMKVLMQIEGERFAYGKTKEDLKKSISDELADILAEVLFIAHELDINMSTAWDNMVKSDELKIETRKK